MGDPVFMHLKEMEAGLRVTGWFPGRGIDTTKHERVCPIRDTC